MAQSHTCGCFGTAAEPEAEAEAEEEAAMPCYCPLDDVTDTVGKKYAMQIVALLGARGPLWYKDFETELAVTSTSTLADRLDQLVEADLIERRSFDEVPPRMEYALTPRGRELEGHLQPLLQWAAQETD